MENLPYGFCGMPCALCLYYHTKGLSRCKGCSHDGFFTGACSIYKCCKKGNVLHCALCPKYPCNKCKKLKEFNCLDSKSAWLQICAVVREKGFDNWYGEYQRKAELLDIALEKYNNGKMKRFLCELFIQNDINRLEELMKQAELLVGSKKEICQQFKKIAEQTMGI